MIVTESALSIKHLTLRAINEIHHAERAHIAGEEQQALADTIEAAEEARVQLEATQAYTMNQMAALRKLNDDMNIKFQRVFNCDLNTWNGSRTHAIKLLGDAGRLEKEQK